jgi:hypothetical protein
MQSVRAYLYSLSCVSATAISQPAGLVYVHGREAEDILIDTVIFSISAAVARCGLFGKDLCWSSLQRTLASLYWPVSIFVLVLIPVRKGCPFIL